MRRTPNRDSLRAKLLQFFVENPGAMITRQQACERFGATLNTLERTVTAMRRDGHIKSLYGPNRVSFYLQGDSPIKKLPKAKTEPKPKEIRRWPSSSSYVPPRPIPISVFEWRP